MLDVRERPTFEEGSSLGVVTVPIPAAGVSGEAEAERTVEVPAPAAGRPAGETVTIAYAIAVE